MTFSNEQLNQFQAEYLTVPRKRDELLERYVTHAFTNARALEYATQGFSRRLKTLAQCIINVFRILPPDGADFPNTDELGDAAINIQAFMFNVFGATDNLAWIWVCQKDIRRAGGGALAVTQVGLKPNDTLVRNSLSDQFRSYLDGLAEWFAHQENYRHALAHRIPLYIPPYSVSDASHAAYRELENKKTEAMRSRRLEEYSLLSAEQDKLGKFRPVIMHSFEEQARPVFFHPQMLADYNTIVELGHKVLEELAR